MAEGLLLIAVIAVAAIVIVPIGISSDKMYKETIAERERKKQERMKKMIVEDVRSVEDTETVSGNANGILMMNGKIGVGTTLGTDRNERVIHHYVYLRDKENGLIQFSVSADILAAVGYLKGKEITVEMFSDHCLWQGKTFRNKIIIEQA